MSPRDVIAAIATAPGRAAVGVVRVSGPDISGLMSALTGGKLAPRRATLVEMRDAAGQAIDSGLALYFPAPRSYTGEDVLELHCHGGQVVLSGVLGRCVELGARLARPGEFTERAFLEGKLDLAQAEAVIDLIDAATNEAARSAMRTLQGAFSAALDSLAREIIELRAFAEATLDFPDEDIDVEALPDLHARLGAAREKLEQVLQRARQGSLLREGVHIVLAGEPNVGKSSLLNQLAGEDLAIVTDIPGTTRDAVRQKIDLGGIPAHVVDTAGLRESDDPVERIGVERAWQVIGQADLVLHIRDARAAAISAADKEILDRLPATASRIAVMNKIDLTGSGPGVDDSAEPPQVWISAKTGAGISLLRQVMLARLGWQQGESGSVFLARERHIHALRTASGHLAAAEGQRQVEFFAEELRLAHDALSSITGRYTSDDLLGEIFQRFCIGK